MIAQRSTDPAPIVRFRSERICAVNHHEFFFDTREGRLKGPYSSREEVLKGIEDYIRQCLGQRG